MLRSLFFALKRPTFPHVWEALAAGKSSVSEESERAIADVSGICSGMGTFIWRTCWLFRFEHRLVFPGRGHDSGESPYSGVNSRGKKLSHGNAFGMFGIAKNTKTERRTPWLRSYLT